MRDKGWTVPDWPKEYGGGGLDGAEHKVLREEMARIGARSPLSSFGIWMLGPALLKFGNEEQKKVHLPKIAAGLIRWCQGYSEPNAGSDLASLQTRAEATATTSSSTARRSGRPMPTTPTGSSAWCAPIPRPRSTTASASCCSTWPQRRVDQADLLISGYSPFCETFFDNVRVPKAHLVGTVNGGWDVAKYLLQHEREMISGMGERGIGRPLGQVAADSVGSDEQGRLDDAMLRGRIVGLRHRRGCVHGRSERVVDLAKAGQSHPAFSSAMKYYGTELNKRRHEIPMSAGGIDALEWESERSATAPARAPGCAPRPIRSRAAPVGGDARHRREAHPRSAGGVTIQPRHSGARSRRRMRPDFVLIVRDGASRLPP